MPLPIPQTISLPLAELDASCLGYRQTVSSLEVGKQYCIPRDSSGFSWGASRTQTFPYPHASSAAPWWSCVAQWMSDRFSQTSHALPQHFWYSDIVRPRALFSCSLYPHWSTACTASFPRCHHVRNRTTTPCLSCHPLPFGTLEMACGAGLTSV